jgi:hypothetical protein
MVAAGMRDSGRRLAVLAAAALALTLVGAGCGEDRQDAGAPSGEFSVDVVDASFPAKQRIAESAKLTLEVENTGSRAVPQLAVIVETEPAEKGQAPVAFGQSVDDPTLAASARPVWVVDNGPAGGDTAYTNTWAVGPLAAGASRTVAWDVTAARAGRYRVAWRLAPALEGDATLADGRTEGEFAVTISDEPVPARVGEDGEVVRGEEAGRD